MKTIRYALGFCLALAVLPAVAATTWSSTGTYSVKAVCTTGNESAPTLVTQGLSLAGPDAHPAPKGLVVVAEADNAQTITSGTLKAYVWDDTVAAWARAPELDLTVAEAGSRRYSWSGFTVTVPLGRIAYVPSTLTLSGGGVTIYLRASP